jgi:hypothetical protein
MEERGSDALTLICTFIFLVATYIYSLVSEKDSR